MSTTYLIPVKSNDSVFDTQLAKAYTIEFAKGLKKEFDRILDAQRAKPESDISEEDLMKTIEKILGAMEVKVRTNKTPKLDANGNPVPKKEATGFVKFSSEQRKTWKDQAKVFVNDKELRAELSKMWKEMTEEQQAVYFPNGRKSPSRVKNAPSPKGEKAKIPVAVPIVLQANPENKFLTSSQANKMKVDELKAYVGENIQAFIGRKPELTLDIIKSMKKTDLVVLVKA